MKQTFRGAMRRVAMLCASVALILSAEAWAIEFSSDVEQTMGGRSAPGKLYIKGEKMRSETEVGGRSHVVIMRPDKEVTWTLMPGEKKYMETPLKKGTDWTDPEMQKKLEVDAEKKSLGKEKLGGYDCDKVQYVYKDKSKGSVTVWIAKKLNYAIKVEQKLGSGAAGFVRELKSIKEGSVADSLFDVPAGYEKTSRSGASDGRGKGRPQQN